MNTTVSHLTRGLASGSLLAAALLAPLSVIAASDPPRLESELIFPLEGWHNHGSCIVEAPNGDLIACWFHGSGERTADDVKVEGARKRRGSSRWSERFVMADTPGYPDTNPCMFIDPRKRLWLLWPTILANRWETALMKYRIAADYTRDGAPRWEVNEVLHVTPGPEFATALTGHVASARKLLATASAPALVRERLSAELDELQGVITNKLSHRLGWMTRAHPTVVDRNRLLVPLYSDGFSFSLMAITDDWGATWHASGPVLGFGNIQPSVVRRRDGSLVAFMRDNGPPPKRLMRSESLDRGETWSPAADTDLPNPGSGAECIVLANGRWALVGNDTEQGRHSLAVWISEDEGRTWPWKRHLERDPAGGESGSYSYPSLLQARDGTLHATYSFHLNRKDLPSDSKGRSMAKAIKHAHFSEAWVRAAGQ